MTPLIALIYGLIQALSEFLPISSSGHLALLPSFLTFDPPGVTFDLMMHLGTAIAVMLYFKRDFLLLINDGLDIVTKRSRIKDKQLFSLFCITTIVSVIFILILKDFAFTFRSNSLIAINLIFFGLLLFLSDFVRKEKPLITDNQWKTAFFIGMSQALAAFPGVSRSGITITAARFLGINKTEAGEFSFILSLPIILASVVYKLPEVLKSESYDLTSLFIGIFISFTLGLATIHFFLKFIKRIKFFYFFLYRVMIGLLVLFLL